MNTSEKVVPILSNFLGKIVDFRADPKSACSSVLSGIVQAVAPEKGLLFVDCPIGFASSDLEVPYTSIISARTLAEDFNS
jgi:hypothetical protein